MRSGHQLRLCRRNAGLNCSRTVHTVEDNHVGTLAAVPPLLGPGRVVRSCSHGSCERIPNGRRRIPAISHCSEPVGTPTTIDRPRSTTARTVANLRCGLETPGNVWMKDTWDDTGAEPDPTQDNEVMWKSPYIWVRNAQDRGAGVLEAASA